MHHAADSILQNKIATQEKKPTNEKRKQKPSLPSTVTAKTTSMKARTLAENEHVYFLNENEMGVNRKKEITKQKKEMKKQNKKTVIFRQIMFNRRLKLFLNVRLYSI